LKKECPDKSVASPSQPKPLYVNPYLFLHSVGEEICVWDYFHHQQFILDAPHLDRLIAHLTSPPLSSSPLDNIFLEEGILSETPFPRHQWGWDLLGQIYHFGTRDLDEPEQRSTLARATDFLNACSAFEKRQLQTGTPDPFIGLPRIDLPDWRSDHFDLNLGKALEARMTSRVFNGESISLHDLSACLGMTFAQKENPWPEADIHKVTFLGKRRTSPSAGGLHSVIPYIVAFHVEGLAPGLYGYDDVSHQLVLRASYTAAELDTHVTRLCGDQFFGENAACGIFFVSRLDQVWTKYPHSRAYRDVFLDGGHLSQTLLLLATSLEWNTWITAYFRDTELVSFLHLRSDADLPLLYVALGKGDRQALHPSVLEALRLRQKEST
jgi:SagB-type dehydrogenase family enzyme